MYKRGEELQEAETVSSEKKSFRFDKDSMSRIPMKNSQTAKWRLEKWRRVVVHV